MGQIATAHTEQPRDVPNEGHQHEHSASDWIELVLALFGGAGFIQRWKRENEFFMIDEIRQRRLAKAMLYLHIGIESNEIERVVSYKVASMSSSVGESANFSFTLCRVGDDFQLRVNTPFRDDALNLLSRLIDNEPEGNYVAFRWMKDYIYRDGVDSYGSDYFLRIARFVHACTLDLDGDEILLTIPWHLLVDRETVR